MAEIDWLTRIRPLLAPLAGLGILAGLGALLAGQPEAAAWIWTLATLPVLAALLGQIAGSLRRGDYGLDIVAALSMSAALGFGETLAAAVVALMYSGGQYLETYAEGRARREMTALLARAPRNALRLSGAGLEEVPLEAIVEGDRLMIRGGEMVPVDGQVAAGVAVLDESALTGEALPVRHPLGSTLMSGPVNTGDAFEMLAARPACESTFAGIARLVAEASRSKAPMVRLADRFALWFLGATLLIAGSAWAITGDPIRLVAVLVVATPCPLILAVPVALVAGLSRAAKQGILIKGGGALERLARIRALVLDKTGTLTDGRARLVAIRPEAGLDQDELLRLAASLDQASGHSIAQRIVEAARDRGLALALPEGVREVAGEGISGRVEGRDILLGGAAFVAARLGRPCAAPRAAGSVGVAVAVDGVHAGELILADLARPGMRALLDGLRAAGVARQVLATGDRRAVAEEIAQGLGFDALRADLTPEAKLAVVLAERANGPVMMIGDGVNDAPALAAADLGVAMGARGAAASAEAADVVLLVDRLDPILAGIGIARRARLIALQSVVVGIGLSVLGMLAAAFGLLSPVQGALTQEAIDVAVILNALRALGPGGSWFRARGAAPGQGSVATG